MSIPYLDIIGNVDVRGLEIHDLRCFVAVAARLNFTRAAADLRMSVPPLSRRIRAMEGTLKTTLFIRDTRRVVLTPSGVKLLPLAEKILHQFDALPDVVSHDLAFSRQTIRYGVPPWLHPELSSRLERLEELYAERLTLIRRRRRSQEAIGAIVRKDLVFGFARSAPTNTTLSSVVVRQESVGAVLSRADYGARTSISLEELIELDYVTDRRDSDTEYRRQVDGLLRATILLKRLRHNPADHSSAAEAISTGGAFAIAPISEGARETSDLYHSAETVCLPIDDLDFVLPTCLVWSTELAQNDRNSRDVIDTAVRLCQGGAPLLDSA